jgi:hypothetical protein
MSEVKAEVRQDPYGYWVYTGNDIVNYNHRPNNYSYYESKYEYLKAIKEARITKNRQIRDYYNANVLQNPPQYKPTKVEIKLDDEYYSNYLDEIRIKIK